MKIKEKTKPITYKEQQKNQELTKFIENNPLKQGKGNNTPKKEKNG